MPRWGHLYLSIPDVHPLLGEKIGVRLARIDAPEVRTKCDAEKKKGIEARDALVERLSQAKVIDLREVERGKYFRLVAEVIADGENMSDLLLALGLAWPYDGAHGSAGFVRGWGRSDAVKLDTQIQLHACITRTALYVLVSQSPVGQRGIPI